MTRQFYRIIVMEKRAFGVLLEQYMNFDAEFMTHSEQEAREFVKGENVVRSAFEGAVVDRSYFKALGIEDRYNDSEVVEVDKERFHPGDLLVIPVHRHETEFVAVEFNDSLVLRCENCGGYLTSYTYEEVKAAWEDGGDLLSNCSCEDCSPVDMEQFR